MLTHLKDTGSSLAVILDGPILEATKIDVTTPLEVSTDGDVIVITPVRDTKRAEKFKHGLVEINRRNASVFRRLAE